MATGEQITSLVNVLIGRSSNHIVDFCEQIIELDTKGLVV